MNSAHWEFPLSSPDPEVRKKSVDGMMKSLKSAKIVGADTVLLVPAVVNDNVTYEQAY
jgi:hexulose-6-phosphate isomerase